MRIRNIILFVFLITLYINCIYGQHPNKVEQTILFSSKIDNPIKIEVLDKGDKLQFYAHNRSYYSYQLILNFNEIINLTPEIVNRKFTVSPGNNNLITLSEKDKRGGHFYQYSVKYTIGIPSKKVAFDYPYLIPLSTYKTFGLYTIFNDSITFINDYFKINVGDTIYNMRKGYVAAAPDMYHDADRISQRESLEIIHKDGTIMIYENINPDSVFVKPGRIAYPTQPLGIINDDLVLKVYLYMIQKDGKLRRLNIHYYISENSTDLFSKYIINNAIKHPFEIITMEMTKRELKNIDKKRFISF